MMLHLYFPGDKIPENLRMVNNVEVEFIPPRDGVSEELKKVLQDVEGATPSIHTCERFVDRFGGEVYWSELSTGMKAAFVSQIPGTIVDASECGTNLLYAIIEHLTWGNFFVPLWSFTLPETSVDVCVRGIHFTDGVTLEEYLREELLIC